VAALVRITIQADTPEQLREVLRGKDLDLNCGGPRKSPDGGVVVEAYAPQAVATRLRRAGVRVQVDRALESRAVARQQEVADGDRYEGGRVPPRGIGRKE
jgi:hypothetical protein